MCSALRQCCFCFVSNVSDPATLEYLLKVQIPWPLSQRFCLSRSEVGSLTAGDVVVSSASDSGEHCLSKAGASISISSRCSLVCPPLEMQALRALEALLRKV